jgi:hypothetical protein
MRNGTLLAWGLVLAVLSPAGAQDAPEANGLALVAEVAPSSVESGTPFVLDATLANTGAEPIEVLLPLHLGSVTFPRWLLRHEDGRVFTTYDGPFQSMWQRGLQGELLRLAPGETKSFRTTVRRVHPFDERMDRPSPTQLAPGFPPPGRYAVVARYEKEDDRVSWSDVDFQTTTRRHEGLWTGRVVSEPVTLFVEPPRRFAVTLEAPARVTSGAPYPIAVHVANHSDEPIQGDVALCLSAGTKAYGSANVRLVFNGQAHRLAMSDDEVWRVRLEPETVRTIRLDLAALTFLRDRPAYPSPVGLYDLLGTGTFHLGVQLMGSDGAVRTEAGMFRGIEGLEPTGNLGGLRLRLETAGHVGNRPRVTATLVNEGTDAVRVPATLSWPRHVFFALAHDGATHRYAVTRDAGRGGLLLMSADGPTDHATLPDPLAWDGDRYETPPPAADQAFALLAPGAALARTFVVGDLLSAKNALDHGGYPVEVTAYWRNRDTGARLSLDPLLAVGLLRSEPVRVSGRGW